MRKLKHEEFLLRAKEKHGEKYDYSNVEYKNNSTPVTIICPDHGLFNQQPGNHLLGKGCIKCGALNSSKKRLFTKKDFLTKAIKKHGNKYDYSKVNYRGHRIKVLIICPDHGAFEQFPVEHYSYGCMECGRESTREKLSFSKDEFLIKAKKVHSGRYDYSNVNFINTKTSVIIGCQIHGFFEQTPASHFQGKGCSYCGHLETAKSKTYTQDDYIALAIRKHGKKYDYSRVQYKNSKDKITIGCPKHGWFEQIAQSHFVAGCEKCGWESQAEKKSFTQEEYISKIKSIHGDTYDYSKVIYKGQRINIKIRCSKHGWFNQSAGKHLSGSGCSKCHNKSEGRLAEYLEKKNIIHRSYRIDNEIKFFDFYLPEYNLLIERDGEQHYIDRGNFFARGDKNYLKKQQDNDRYKTNLAKNNGYKIARIPFWLNDKQVEKEIENILSDNPTYPDVPDLKQVKTKPLPN